MKLQMNAHFLDPRNAIYSFGFFETLKMERDIISINGGANIFVLPFFVKSALAMTL